MFNYHMTPTEQAVEELYQQLNITEPNQIDMFDIARKLNIWLHFEPIASISFSRNDMHSMIIDSRLSPQEQWEDFGHELYHLIRNAGNQLLLPESFVRMQESRADNFALDFCIPTFMLLNMPLTGTRPELIETVAETFNVTPQFAEKRLKKHEIRLSSNSFFNEFKAAIEANRHLQKEVGFDYAVRTKTATMLYSRKRGVIGYIKDDVYAD